MKQRMIKEDIIAEVCRDTRLPKHVVENVVNCTLSNITMALSLGKEVKFAGFGTFEPKQRAARTGRNPHTNEPVHIPARVMPTFKPGSLLKTAVIKTVAK